MTELIPGNPDWSVDPADYSVGIFQDLIIHEACPKDDPEPADKIYAKGDHKGSGANRVVEMSYIVRCPSCAQAVTLVEVSSDPDFPEEQQ